MKTKQSTRHRIRMTLLAIVMTAAVVLPMTPVSAAVTKPDKGTFIIHKLHFPDPAEEEDAPAINGDGTEIDPARFPTATAIQGATFHFIEIKNVTDLGENPTQEEAKRFYDAHKDDPNYAKAQGATDINGIFRTPELPAAKYLIYEVNDDSGAKQTTAPIVAWLPMMNPDGQSWNADIHLYAKEISTLGAANLFKYKGETGKTSPLAGAKFNLYYKGNDGRDSIVEADLLTDLNGYTPIVSNLVVGKYYFQETSAPQGYLLNANKYEFEIKTTDHAFDPTGAIIDAKVIKVGSTSDTKNNVANYLAPTIDKALLTPSSSDIGVVNTWQISSDIPANIMQYTEYEISDTLDSRLDYKGNLSIKVDGSAVNPAAYNITAPTVSNPKLKVTFVSSSFGGALSQLNGKSKITITFDTVINKTAVPGVEIPNSATLAYNNSFVAHTTDSIHAPTVVTGGRQFLKVNTSAQTLQGAQFKIYRMNGETKEYAVQDSAMNVTWNTDKAQGNVFTSSATGNFEMKGLAYGDYFIEEIKAPTGYNLLTQDVHFVVDKNSYAQDNTITIQNSNQPVIPVTGGIGTIIFFVGGGALMATALFFLLKKKKKDEDENEVTVKIK